MLNTDFKTVLPTLCSIKRFMEIKDMALTRIQRGWSELGGAFIHRGVLIKVALLVITSILRPNTLRTHNIRDENQLFKVINC